MEQPLAIEPGLRAVVTAGASGIGRAIVEALAGTGARVHICDVDREALAACAAALPDIGTTLCDVADPDQVKTLFDTAVARLGGLDVLVNNAGIAGPTAAVDAITPADWRRTIDVDLNGMFYCTHYAVPHLKAAGEGAIVNLSSVAGRLGYAFRTPYAAAKWGVIGLTQSLAKELGPHRIRVNAILPGIVAGDRIERVIAARADATGQTRDAVAAQMLERVSLRRMVQASDVAAMVLFLCSDGGRNVSGQSLSVCGNVETL